MSNGNENCEHAIYGTTKEDKTILIGKTQGGNCDQNNMRLEVEIKPFNIN
jgi:hypothetical protein